MELHSHRRGQVQVNKSVRQDVLLLVENPARIFHFNSDGIIERSGLFSPRGFLRLCEPPERFQSMRLARCGVLGMPTGQAINLPATEQWRDGDKALLKAAVAASGHGF